MSRLKRSSPSVSILTSLWLGGLLLSTPSAQAGSKVTFNPPRGGAPHQTRGGASRGDTAPQLIALIPHSASGLTLKAYPTFFVYIPPTSAQEVFFSLRDETGQVTYQTTLPIANLPIAAGGILRVDLPDTAPALQVGKSYQWGIALLSAGKLRPDSPFIASWIQRSQTSPAIADAEPSLENAALYGSSGIWYDALSTLADLRQQQPDNTELTIIWQNLLNSVELNSISSALLLKAS